MCRAIIVPVLPATDRVQVPAQVLPGVFGLHPARVPAVHHLPRAVLVARLHPRVEDIVPPLHPVVGVLVLLPQAVAVNLRLLTVFNLKPVANNSIF